MKKLIYFFTILLFSVVACQTNSVEEQSETSITGYFDNISGKEIILAIQTPEGIMPIDTTVVLEDGYFAFTPVVGDVQLYRVITGFNQFITFALQKGDHIHMEADGLDVTGYYVEGSQESILISEVSKEITRHRFLLDSLSVEIKHLTAAKNGKALFAVFEMQKKVHSDHHDFSLNFINNHPGSLAAYFIVFQLQLTEDAQAYLLVQEELSKSHPSFNFLPTLNERVGILSKAVIGTEAPELAYESPNGEIIALSSLRGKYVLIDFWASWCKPCRAENPHVKALYEQYKDKGFEIYGYSLDQERESWLNAIEEDQINWIHTSDLLGWKAQGSLDYGVQAIPATVLIDPNGIILARDLRGEDLDNMLAEIFQ